MVKLSTNASTIESVRHSLAHILAAAVLKKYPKAQLGIGPAIDTGFYYDIKFLKPIIQDDLANLEQSMRDIIAEGLEMKGEKVSAAKARSQFKSQTFKLDLINEFVKEKKQLTIYHLGEKPTKKTIGHKPSAFSYFLDLCKGGHVKNTKEINPDGFKLLKLAGAYWRGNEKNPQLTRIYGAAFATKEELDKYLEFLKEAAERDHRKIGKELGLFVFSDLIGPGLPLYTPRGTGILQRIKDYSRALRKSTGYEEVQTPQINKGELYKASGHYDVYLPNIFKVESNYGKEEYFMKPMNCPQHTQIYMSEVRSYRDLPIRYADFAILYRDEKPGELSGLTRLRSFSQDDGHVFLREDQLEEEFSRILGVINTAMSTYGLEYYIRLSLRDEKKKSEYIGADAVWKKSQAMLKKFLQENNLNFVEAPGEAAFYGPKMDLIATDALGREWQLSTIQLDMNIPERFQLEYIGEDGKKHRPIMIHSALVGSPERLLGVLIEHYKGAFPFWLAPTQVKILTINDRVLDYAADVKKELIEQRDLRVELDDRNESLGKKIREAEMQKTPYILIIGEKEKSARMVNVRERGVRESADKRVQDFLLDLPLPPTI